MFSMGKMLAVMTMNITNASDNRPQRNWAQPQALACGCEDQ